MRLPQFLSGVFPRLTRSKWERNQQKNSDPKRNTSKSHLSAQPLSSLKLSNAVHPVEQDRDGQTESLDCSETLTVDDSCCFESRPNGEYYRPDVSSDLMGSGKGSEYALQSAGAKRSASSITRSRSKIRTNPWLTSPKRAHHPDQFQNGPSISLPTTPTTFHSDGILSSSVGLLEFDKTMTISPLPTTKRDFGLHLPVPGNADDSASEGYASSLFRSPSLTDLDSASVEGGVDSALSSSLSSESDSEWIGHSTKFPDEDIIQLESTETQIDGFIKDDDCVGNDLKDISCEGQESTKQSIVMDDSDCTSIQHEQLSKKISGGVKDDEVDDDDAESQLLIFEKQMEVCTEYSIDGCDFVREMCQKDEAYRLSSEDISTEKTQEQAASSQNTCDESTVKGEGKGLGEDDVSSRPLTEVSESLQDKVLRLHEQKQYVDALFLKAREEDKLRTAEITKIRSALIASRKQTLLKQLQMLGKMLGCQANRLQVIYDMVLAKQWPKVYRVRPVKPMRQV